MNATKTRITEDVLIGIDRALSYYDQELTVIRTLDDDLLACLRAAQAWLMSVQSEILAEEVEAETI